MVSVAGLILNFFNYSLLRALFYLAGVLEREIAYAQSKQRDVGGTEDFIEVSVSWKPEVSPSDEADDVSSFVV